MSNQKRWRLLCYDVRDPKRYRKVFKIIRGVARPVQYSVFRSRLDDRQLEKLRWELEQVMEDVDALLVIDLCPRCAGRVVERNRPTGWCDDEPSFRILASSPDQEPSAGLDSGPADGDQVGEEEEDAQE